MFNTIRNILIPSAALLLTCSGSKADNILSLRDTITDPSFVYPESYEADTHRLLQDWYLTAYTSLDRPADPPRGSTAPDEEYIKRLQAMPAIIEMPFNSIVKGCIERYVERRPGQVERMLGMSTYYFPIFEQALEEEGVPLELRYLPIIESALDPNAVSRAGATGLWQFMLATARGLGLEISSLVDERRDPVRSSKMAARYLRQLYDMYGDWSLAIAAYNCGPGNVNKALKRAGDGKKDFWEIYQFLPAETRGYLPGFIAANYAMTNYGRHGISPVLAKRPIITDSVHVSRRVHFRQIADVLGMPIEEIRLLNPQYRQDIIPGDIRPYPLVLPSHQALAYIMSEDSIVAHNAHLYERRATVEPADGSTRVSDDGEYIIKEVTKYHKVRSGETFTAIARRYGVTVGSIKRVNGIKTLKAGRTIKIVTTEKIAKPVEEATDTIDVAEETIPVTFDEATAAEANVESDGEAPAEQTDLPTDEGDESEEVEEPASVDTPQNNEETTDNAPDRKIRDTFASRTPAEEPAPQPAPAKQQPKPQSVTVKVKKGDTLSKIARNNGITLKKIQQLNPGINPSKIKPGDRIRVK